MRRETLDQPLRRIEVAAPEKYRRSIDQCHAQINRVVTLTGHVDRTPRGAGGAIRQSHQPVTARKHDQRANLMIVAKEEDLRGTGNFGLRQAAFTMTPGFHLVSGQVIGDAKHRFPVATTPGAPIAWVTVKPRCAAVNVLAKSPMRLEKMLRPTRRCIW